MYDGGLRIERATLCLERRCECHEPAQVLIKGELECRLCVVTGFDERVVALLQGVCPVKLGFDFGERGEYQLQVALLSLFDAQSRLLFQRPQALTRVNRLQEARSSAESQAAAVQQAAGRIVTVAD